jgi:predicted regulator of Ras-like GTPase activity (Roadblock/LC7/MglB family)
MFKQALTNIVERTEGAIGALIMGTDGIAVEKVLMPELRRPQSPSAGAARADDRASRHSGSHA